MIWIAIAALAAAALLPLLAGLRRGARTRGAQDLAVALHRSQLVELDRDLVEGRILPSEHATALLEVQRRLLAAAAQPETAGRAGSRWPVVAALLLVPAAALGLYAVGGQPAMPSLPPGAVALRQQRARDEAVLVARLTERMQAVDPASDQARNGYTLLGTVEEARGNDAAAAQAFRRALLSGFDPVLAIRAAEAATRAEGGLSTGSAALLRQALAAAPADAPWREAVAARLKESGL